MYVIDLVKEAVKEGENRWYAGVSVVICNIPNRE